MIRANPISAQLPQLTLGFGFFKKERPGIYRILAFSAINYQFSFEPFVSDVFLVIMNQLTTSVLAKRADVPVFTVRHYTRIGLLNPSRLESNGYKVYSDSDVTLLRFITNAKELGFTLKEIAQIVDMADHGESPCPVVRDIIAKRVAENRNKLTQLRKLQKKLENAEKQWKTMKDEVPTGHSVCHLIESFSD